MDQQVLDAAAQMLGRTLVTADPTMKGCAIVVIVVQGGHHSMVANTDSPTELLMILEASKSRVRENKPVAVRPIN